MKALLESILQVYGNLVTMQDSGVMTSFRAFVQPVTQKGWQNMQKVIGALGEIPMGQFVYIGPADRPLARGSTLQAQGKTYLVRRAETIYLADEALYIWALLTQAGGETAWNS